jgi:hypothetical protein
MLVLSGFFEDGKFVPDVPVVLPQKTKVIIRVEEEKEDTPPFIPDEVWDKCIKELEAVEGEELPENFAERFRLTNFRTPEELGL